MSANSKIEWTGRTWNPIRARRKDTGKVGWHCERASPGCQNCYAERMNGRTDGLVGIGTGLPYTRPAREQVELFLDEKTLVEPLKWRKPRMVFPCSMTDMFADFVPDEWIERIFAVMALCPEHTFQVLTKRVDRMEEWLSRPPGHINNVIHLMTKKFGREVHGTRYRGVEIPYIGERADAIFTPANGKWPLPNIWLGVSVENQEYADKRIPHLLRTPAAVRWVSAEPLLGPVDLSGFMVPKSVRDAYTEVLKRFPCETRPQHLTLRKSIDWVVVGGESGPGARPMHPEWARSIRDQCQAAGVPFFFKQWGDWAPTGPEGVKDITVCGVDGWAGSGKREALAEHVREFHGGEIECPPFQRMYFAGKKHAGRLLDVREWNEFPADAGEGVV